MALSSPVCLWRHLDSPAAPFGFTGFGWPALRATLLLGLLTTSQYLLGVDFGIDPLLFREPAGTVRTLSPGRMAPATAVDFILLGGALAMIGFRRAILAAQSLALLAGATGLLALEGYLYGAPNLHGLGHNTQMSIHAAALFVILGLGVLMARPCDGFMRIFTGDAVGSWLTRRLLPFVVSVPLVLGWLRVKGEQCGCFEATFGVALMMLTVMVILGGMIWWTARSLNRQDTVRRQAEEELRRSREFLNKILNCIRDPIFVMDDQHRYVLMNDAGCRPERAVAGERAGPDNTGFFSS